MRPLEVFNALQKALGWKIGDRVALPDSHYRSEHCHIVRGFAMVMHGPATFTAKVEKAEGKTLREAMQRYASGLILVLPHELAHWSEPEPVEPVRPAIGYRKKGAS